MRVLGITGGVATGKSLVVEAFRAEGAEAISADEVVREVTAAGSEAVRRVAEELGPDYVTPEGRLDRTRLGQLVFSDSDSRRKLESIVHPPVLKRIRDAIEHYRNLPDPPEVFVVEVPLLFEVGIEDWFDAVIVVAASEENQVQRQRLRDGLSEDEARRRIQAQMPLNAKVARADVVIWNNGKPEDVRSAVREIMHAVEGDTFPSRTHGSPS